MTLSDALLGRRVYLDTNLYIYLARARLRDVPDQR